MSKIPSDDVLESLFKLRIRDSEQLRTVLELYDLEIRQSLGTDSKNTIHSVYGTSSKYPGKQKNIAWKNTSQTSSSAKSPHYEI